MTNGIMRMNTSLNGIVSDKSLNGSSKTSIKFRGCYTVEVVSWESNYVKNFVVVVFFVFSDRAFKAFVDL